MNAQKYFLISANWMNFVAAHLKRSDFGSSTPAVEWSVRDLVAHIVMEFVWVRPLVAGKTIEEVGDKLSGDLLGDKPMVVLQEAYQDACGAVKEHKDIHSTVHLSYGDFDVEYYLYEIGSDLLIHGWDMACE